MTDPRPAEGTPAPLIVIAAGGQGSRMGGDKAGRLLAGRRLIDHAIAWAQRQGDKVAIAAAPGAVPDAAGLPVLIDRDPQLGPIAALLSAMHHAAALGRGLVVLIGCDTPFLPDDLIARLGRAIGPAGAALPRRGGRVQTLAGLWHVDPAGLARWIAAGGRSPWGYAEATGLVMVDWPEDGDDPFANLNTPDDLALAEARIRAGAR
ncbi:molybdenum cofactor guanylyltransferase [Novosphingobium sp.]|uniref:molybdenum cofactor guanylyltransferase n=1 Tax=Novosphingobium sp. TaxID=1874826 RepID=UPI0026265AE6|nr:molybdenum cofactor guanylyltransferase [Novosphingobium sp.]